MGRVNNISTAITLIDINQKLYCINIEIIFKQKKN